MLLSTRIAQVFPLILTNFRRCPPSRAFFGPRKCSMEYPRRAASETTSRLCFFRYSLEGAALWPRLPPFSFESRISHPLREKTVGSGLSAKPNQDLQSPPKPIDRT